MKIGIDCRPIIREKTGIGYYLWEILNAWGRENIQHELHLYAPREFKVPSDLASSKTNFYVHVVHMKPSELWMHTVLPFQLKHDDIDVYWGPNYAMPIVSYGVGRPPTVLTVHDTVYRVFPETLKKVTYLHNRYGLERYVHKATRILVPSRNTRKDVMRFLGVDQDKIVVTPLGVSERMAKLTDAESLNEIGLKDEPFILTVGTLEPRKNLKRVVQAFQEMNNRFPESHLVVVGAGGWGGVAQDLNATQHPNVHYLGYVSEAMLSALYQQARIFAYLPLYEGFGLPPLEAMKAGTPVLTSNTSSLPEVVGKCGLYANPYDVEDMGDKMASLWENDALRDSLSTHGVERAKGMKWETTAFQTLRAIEEVVS